MVTFENVTNHARKSLNHILVKFNNEIIGQLEKYNNTKNTKHPWKAFNGVGLNTKFISSHYGDSGKKDAIDAILAANNLRLEVI